MKKSEKIDKTSVIKECVQKAVNLWLCQFDIELGPILAIKTIKMDFISIENPKFINNYSNSMVFSMF